MVRWFGDGKGNPKAFSYLFTGEESRRYLHNFVFLVEAMKGERDLQPVDLFCMSLPPYAFHYGMLSHFFVDCKLTA